MTPSEYLDRFLASCSRPGRPDGRYLYAYKCGDQEYAELKELVQKTIGPALRNSFALEFSLLFCLYAAETWRRNHVGGVWKWDTVFEAIGHKKPENQTDSWVEDGLRFWQRPLLKSRQGHREFLLTIACEGGLPLKLLQRENTHLKRYFRELLAEYHLSRHIVNMDALARQIAALYLPPSLRQDIVYHLSGILIEAVVELQAKVPDSSDPIAALDKQDKKWRDTLPLSLEDDTVKALLGGLIRQVKDLALIGQQRLRWWRRLIPLGEGWTLESCLELPAIVTGASMRAWTKQDKHPSRVRLLLQTPLCQDRCRLPWENV